MITPTGEGLTVLITTDYTIPFNWMSFASWYSVMKTLPDAKVHILCARNKNEFHQLYLWPYKVGAEFFMHRGFKNYNHLRYLNKLKSLYHAVKEKFIDGPCLVLDADMMALRELSTTTLEVLNSEDVEFATNKAGYAEKMRKSCKHVSEKLKDIGGCWYFKHLTLGKIIGIINTVKKVEEVVCKNETSPVALEHIDILGLANAYGEKTVIIDSLCAEAYEEGITDFAHFGESCGNFVKKEWMESQRVLPFHSCFRYRTLHMTANERRIFELWKQMADAYDIANRNYD